MIRFRIKIKLIMKQNKNKSLKPKVNKRAKQKILIENLNFGEDYYPFGKILKIIMINILINILLSICLK